MAEAEQVPEAHNGPSQSRIVLAKPRLGGFGGVAFSTDSSKSSGNPFVKSATSSVLRPPQLKPVLGANPFLRAAVAENSTPKEEPNKDERLKDTKDAAEAPKFVPLAGNTKSSNPVPAPNQSASTSSSSGFVFGQNLSERVIGADAINNGGFSDHCATNGNSELLFTAAVASNQTDENASSSTTETNTSDSLAAAAAEYERSHARPALLTAPAAPTTTGEEDETNVMQVTCRLFAWESGSWRERGRGVLRLNDSAASSRLVCRVLGSLRVVLNTQVWPEMVADRAGPKSLRITAADAHNQVKVFLVMATPSDILHLHRELTTRISRASSLKSTNERTSTQSKRSEGPQIVFTAPGVDDLPTESNIPDEDMSHDGIDKFEKVTKETEVQVEEKVEDNDEMSQDGIEKVKEVGVQKVAEEDSVGNKPEDVQKLEEKVEENVGNKEDEVKENTENEAKINQLKRKDADGEETGVSPKRQCPKIVIE